MLGKGGVNMGEGPGLSLHHLLPFGVGWSFLITTFFSTV